MGRLLKCIPSRNGSGSSRNWRGFRLSILRRKSFLSRVNYWGQVVEMDGQGRLLMPQLLRESAQIKGEVAVTGQPDVSGSSQPGSVPPGDRGRQVHA